MAPVNPATTPPPFWNVVSLMLPTAAFVAGVILLSSTSRNGDYAGALGDALRFAVLLSVVGAFGEGAAITSLYRGERWAGLSLLGVLCNCAVLVPGLLLLMRAALSD